MNRSFQCQIDQIYADNPQEEPPSKICPTLKRNMVPSNVLSEKKQIASKVQDETQNDFQYDSCEACSDPLTQGEIIYYCLCEKFYHPNCLVKLNPLYTTSPCPFCSTGYTAGIYKLKTPLSSLNINYTTPYSKNEENFMVSPQQDQNSTCEKTYISMNTNINKLENYDKICDMAWQMNPESLAEIIRYDNTMSLLNSSSKDENINNINNNSNNNVNTNTGNKVQLNRIALSPINNINTPYSGKSKIISTSSTDMFKYGRQQETTPNYKINHTNNNDTTPDISFNKVRQHLTFCSNNKSDSNKNKKVNVSLYSIFEGQNSSSNSSGINIANGTINNSNVSFRNLLFDDIDEETGVTKEEDEDDKENCPPLPKENSKYLNGFSNESNPNEKEIVDINIEGGISHIVSDTNKIVEIPITVDLQMHNKSNLFNYAKDTLLIFNTIELNISTILQILKIAYDKMGEYDRIFSNIFKASKWLTKDELFSMFSSPNFSSYFQETTTLDYANIAKLILYGIDLSFEFHSNIFSIVFINDIDEIGTEIDYTDTLKEIVNKLQETKINLIKQFTVNSILLDDKGKNKNENKSKFISYMYELSMICMGYFYSPKDANELMKSICLFYSTLEQTALLNVKLIIKGNKDPSIYIEGMNYPLSKKSHNYFEIFLGSLMQKERKYLNLNATVILNNNQFSLNLPLLEVSCEYLIQKNQIINFENNSSPNSSTSSNKNTFTSSLSSIQSLVRNRTNFYGLSIPIISLRKEVSYSNTVFLRNISAKTIQSINEGINMFKENKFEVAYNKFYDAKINFDQMIKTQTGLFNHLQFLAEHTLNPNNNVSYVIDDSCSFSLSTIHSNSNIKKILHFVMMIFNDLNYLMESAKNKNINSLCLVYSIGESLSFYRAVMLEDERFIEDIFVN